MIFDWALFFKVQKISPELHSVTGVIKDYLLSSLQSTKKNRIILDKTSVSCNLKNPYLLININLIY